MNKSDLSLEERLRKSDPGLAERLDQIKFAAATIWKNPRLRWFTGHGLDHSISVIDLASQILAPLSHGNPNFLTGDELFILLSSCYLHDIGMQDLRVDGRTSDTLGPHDYQLIRKLHPRRSAELIRAGAIDLGGQDGIININIERDYLEAIMIVSEAHGTEYFEGAISELTTNSPAPKNRSIRCPLLAAVLLMADELDLHERRVSQCLSRQSWKLENYPPESLLHIFKHHYITQVRILDAQSYRRQIHLRFQFPAESEEYAGDIVESVTNKLSKRFKLTQNIFLSTGLSWEPNISVESVPDVRSTRESMPLIALPYLLKETYERRLVNRDDLLKKLENILCGRTIEEDVVFIRGENGSDIAYILEWFIADCNCHSEIAFCQLDFVPELNRGRTYVEDGSRSLFAPGARAVITVSNLQNAEKGVQDWLWKKWLPQLISTNKECKIIVVIFAEGHEPHTLDVPFSVFSVSCFELFHFSEIQVADHLSRKRAISFDEANRAACLMDPCSVSPSEIISRICIAFEEGRSKWTS